MGPMQQLIPVSPVITVDRKDISHSSVQIVIRQDMEVDAAAEAEAEVEIAEHFIRELVD